MKAEWGDDFDARAPLPLLERWQYGLREAATDQVVVLSQVLAHPSNVGYEHLVNVQLKACNGEPVRNLKHLVQLVEKSKERFVRFEVGPTTSSSRSRRRRSATSPPRSSARTRSPSRAPTTSCRAAMRSHG